MTPLLLAAVILVAVLVGVAIPVLLQLRATLKSAQKLLESAGPRLERALEEVTKTTERVNRLGAAVEDGARHARELLDTASRIRDSLRTAVAVGSAVGPAIAAAVRAFVTAPDGNDQDAAPPEVGPRGDSPSSGKEAQP